MAAEPVTMWENEEANGLALCSAPLFARKLDLISKLRNQQAEYYASLPTDPKECISAAMGALHEDGSDHPKGFEEALFLSFALGPMIKDMMAHCYGPDRAALLHVADQIKSGLESAATALNHAYAILENADRIECERRARNLGACAFPQGRMGNGVPSN